MKTAEEWVEHLGMGVWTSDILEIQRDSWEAATKAQMDLSNGELVERVHVLVLRNRAPFPRRPNE